MQGGIDRIFRMRLYGEQRRPPLSNRPSPLSISPLRTVKKFMIGTSNAKPGGLFWTLSRTARGRAAHLASVASCK
jgi:hypothetical protein